ncbi:MAG: ATP-dependent sacrificial sulfur transferase LarE [Liquorilactobacillus ghanensis]|jgi:uncharacterized protein|uniref:ATP-dependent sacrificial sulfur transferase LarE n=1 Tax=Liquorilactobacillus ghanensis TaxID=399370 RepID=UPI0039E995EB
MNLLNNKEQKLQSVLASYDRVVVGFSGGIDSTLVLNEALQVLGKENVLAVVADSELFSEEEYVKAIDLAAKMEVNVKGIQLDYLAEKHIKHNTPESWYYMKQIFYHQLHRIAAKFNADAVLDGMIMDDEADFRPGLRARDEAGAVSVLQVAGFYKTDVRQLAQEHGLTNWNKVASCSVSSRFPYYTELTSAKLQQVIAAESYLRHVGFGTVRVRVHDKLARIEVPADRMNDLVAQKDQVTAKLQSLGYEYVSVDLEGFVSGRMNQTLSAAKKEKILVG